MTRMKYALAWSAGSMLHGLRHPTLPSTRRGRLVLALVLVVLLGGGAGGYYWIRSTTLPDDAAFAVGDQVVTVAQLNQRLQTLQALYGVRTPTDPRKLDDFHRTVAKAVAVGMVLRNRAAAMNIVIPDTVARDTLDKYLAQQLGPGPDAHAKFVQLLANAGTSESAVLDEIKQQLAISKMFDAVTHGVTVTDQDLRDQFPKYQAKLSVQDTRHLVNIVVPTQEEGQQILQRLQGGAAFADLARTYSVDGSTRDKGGDLGTVNAAQLQPDYAKVAFAAPQGQAFGPVQDQYGWNVGQVLAVQPGTPAVFDQVKDKLRTLVLDDRRFGTWGAWLTAAIRDGHVRYADAYRPADPDSAPTGIQAGLSP